MRKFLENVDAGIAKTIVMFLVVALLFSALIGTIAYNLINASENASVAAIPGGAIMVEISALMAIIIFVMYGIKKAFGR